MADREMVADVGIVELVQLGMFGRVGEQHVLDPTLLSLIVLNDRRDVRYEIKAGSETRVIEPGGQGENCVVLVTGPDPDPEQMDLAAPSRLFRAYFDGHAWPDLKFQSQGSSDASGTLDTACVLLCDQLNWTSVERAKGHFGLLSELPPGARVWECTRTRSGDQRVEIFKGDIDSVTVVNTSGLQPGCCTTGWPP